MGSCSEFLVDSDILRTRFLIAKATSRALRQTVSSSLRWIMRLWLRSAATPFSQRAPRRRNRHLSRLPLRPRPMNPQQRLQRAPVRRSICFSEIVACRMRIGYERKCGQRNDATSSPRARRRSSRRRRTPATHKAHQQCRREPRERQRMRRRDGTSTYGSLASHLGRSEAETTRPVPITEKMKRIGTTLAPADRDRLVQMGLGVSSPDGKNFVTPSDKELSCRMLLVSILDRELGRSDSSSPLEFVKAQLIRNVIGDNANAGKLASFLRLRRSESAEKLLRTGRAAEVMRREIHRNPEMLEALKRRR